MRRSLAITAVQSMGRILGIIGIVLSATLLAIPAAGRAQQIEVPAIPDPVPVTLTASSTALIVSDLTPQNCNALPSCVAALAPVASLLARARQAGVLVAYTTAAGLASSGFEPEVAPLPSEPVFVRPGPAQGTWWGNDLDALLAANGIDTVILVGSQAAGIVLDGAFWASYVDGYTVVAPVDGMPSPSDFRLIYTEFQALNQPSGKQNPTNNPLEPGATTLSRTDLISFR